MNNIPVNAIVGQSGGPTCAINATLYGVITSCQSYGERIKTLYGMKNGIEGFLKEDFVDLFSFFEDKSRLELLPSTPAAFLGSCRRKLPSPKDDEAFYARIIDILKRYNIRYFFYIGGNDSMDTVAKLAQYTFEKNYDICVIGIPKTIDNDLVMTDHTPGYGSSAKYISTVTSEIIRDCAVYTQKAVTIIEIMGRDTGWLTTASALAGADLIYLSERAFSTEKFILDVDNALNSKHDIVVAVSEGIRYANGRYVSENNILDPFGHTALTGASRVLAQVVKEHIGCKSRAIELSLTQRCSSHIASLTDIEESKLIGAKSVELALQEQSGVMTAFKRKDPYGVDIISVPAIDVANKIKYVPKEFINAEGNGVTQACLDYLKPLIMGEHYPNYKDGLPIHCKL